MWSVKVNVGCDLFLPSFGWPVTFDKRLFPVKVEHSNINHMPLIKNEAEFIKRRCVAVSIGCLKMRFSLGLSDHNTEIFHRGRLRYPWPRFKFAETAKMKLNSTKNEARTTLVNVANHNRLKRKSKQTNESSCETDTAVTERGKIRRRSSFGLASN